MPPVARPARSNCRTSDSALLSAAQLGKGLTDSWLAFDDCAQEADPVDVAVVIPGGLHQDAGLLLWLDGEAVQRLGEQLAIEPADLLGRVLDRVHAGVALDAVMVRHVAEALAEFLLERQHGRDRRVGRKAHVPARAIRRRARHVDHLLPQQRGLADERLVDPLLARLQSAAPRPAARARCWP